MSFGVRKWLPTRRNRLALEAVFELAIVRVLRSTISFGRLAKLFGEPQVESPLEVDVSSQLVAKEIAVAISRAVRYAPFRCNCLTQAICGLRMLKRRSISATLYLGVDRDDNSTQDAHAWLRSGDCILTGNHQLERYKAVFKFARS